MQNIKRVVIAHIVDSKSMILTSENSCQEEKSRFQKVEQTEYMYMSHTDTHSHTGSICTIVCHFTRHIFF